MSDLAATLTGGAWTAFHKLTESDQQVFNEALEGFVGVKYVPESVSTQVVSGTNYRYNCNASLPSGGETWKATVEIYAPLTGKPHITKIDKL